MKFLPRTIHLGADDDVPITRVDVGSDGAGVPAGHYDASSNVIVLNARDGAFLNYAALFEIVIQQAQLQCKASGAIHRLAGADFVHHVAFETVCILAMSGMLAGLDAPEATTIIESRFLC